MMFLYLQLRLSDFGCWARRICFGFYLVTVWVIIKRKYSDYCAADRYWLGAVRRLWHYKCHNDCSLLRRGNL